MNIKQLVPFFITFSLLVASPFALADSANPPRVLGIKIVNEKAVYAPGDEIIYEIEYSGGNPGIKDIQVPFRPTKGGTCIGFGNFSGGYLGWAEGKSYSNLNVGPINDRIIRLRGTITSDCANGINTFETSFVVLTDKTDLTATTFLSPPSINIKDGKYIPPGTVLGSLKKSVVDLQALQDSYVIDESKPTVVQLPRFNSDGILILYRESGLRVCGLLRDSSGYGYQLSLEKKGICEVEASILLTRSEYSNVPERKRIVLASKAETEAKAAADLLAKQEAEARAAAELLIRQEAEAKAAAELRAQQAADAMAKAKAAAKAVATKKSTITCTKGKLIKKVTAIKPKCPTGYKVKR